MLLNLEHEGRFDVLADKLRLAPALTTALFSDVKIRTNPHSPTVRTDRIDQLIRARAWNDAALALVELELLAWKLRRLAYEDGEWHCSLSRQPNLPAALDDTAHASHEVMPLAILGALVEAHRRMSATRRISLQTVPRARAVLTNDEAAPGSKQGSKSDASVEL
jgi:hypothetical protein